MIDFPSGIIQGILSNPKQKDQKYLKAKLNRIRLKNQEARKYINFLIIRKNRFFMKILLNLN